VVESGSRIHEKVERLAGALGLKVPPDLAVAAAQLAQTTWPEIVESWSRLTPTGFPIELTITEGDCILRWAAEIAGPEIAEARRLELVASRLAAAGQPVSSPLLRALQAAQSGRDLRYGAWIGGRAIHNAQTRFKLYGEIPPDVSFDEIPLPPALREPITHTPAGALARMIGIEPARNRIEIYLRLPMLDPDDLCPLLLAAGHEYGLDLLYRSLPDGKRRLVGRRLGISLAVAAAEPVEVALFVSARSLFPAAPEILRGLVPAIAKVPETFGRLTLVTLGLNPKGNRVSFAVGVTIAAASVGSTGLNVSFPPAHTDCY
jgi:hypothetical protein